MQQRLDKLISSQGTYTRKQAQQLIKDGINIDNIEEKLFGGGEEDE